VTRTLAQQIVRNRRRNKYQRWANQIRLRIFDYQDAGKGQQAEMLIEKLIAACVNLSQKRG